MRARPGVQAQLDGHERGGEQGRGARPGDRRDRFRDEPDGLHGRDGHRRLADARRRRRRLREPGRVRHARGIPGAGGPGHGRDVESIGRQHERLHVERGEDLGAAVAADGLPRGDGQHHGLLAGVGVPRGRR